MCVSTEPRPHACWPNQPATNPPTNLHSGSTCATAGLTEAEKEEGAKAREAMEAEQGASDDEGDYRKGAKVG